MTTKQIILFLSLTLVITLSTLVFGKGHRTWLVLDMINLPELPRHFRTTSEPLANKFNPHGLAELKALGSGQFSSLSLEAILKKLNTKSLTIIDLRQESHGFLNGHAISWYGPHNANNENQSPQHINLSETKLLQTVQMKNAVKVFTILRKTANEVIDEVEPTHFKVKEVMNESDIATQQGVQYQRFYIQDFHAAEDQEVDRFINLVKGKPHNHWLYFHCRAGVGRTTMFMVMYDMLRNAKEVSFEDIMKRQHAIGGKDLSALPKRHIYKYQLSKNRFQFLRKFYDYARENSDHYQTSWSEWIKRV
ncbi:MAG: hypothetical protein H0W64_04100 [Gammaproteobacteria bacterium]|nr:hypothetical protein [Gammaproteobacteria bacterium]